MALKKYVCTLTLLVAPLLTNAATDSSAISAPTYYSATPLLLASGYIHLNTTTSIPLGMFSLPCMYNSSPPVNPLTSKFCPSGSNAVLITSMTSSDLNSGGRVKGYVNDLYLVNGSSGYNMTGNAYEVDDGSPPCFGVGIRWEVWCHQSGTVSSGPGP